MDRGRGEEEAVSGDLDLAHSNFLNLLSVPAGGLSFSFSTSVSGDSPLLVLCHIV